MIRFPALVASWMCLAACDSGSACDRANEELAECLPDGTTTSPTVTDSGIVIETCTEGSTAECAANCVLTALDAGGCEAVTEQTKNSDYLKCSVDCIDAGSK